MLMSLVLVFLSCLFSSVMSSEPAQRVEDAKWDEINELKLTLDAAKQHLETWNLNAEGPLGVLVKRIRACRKCVLYD